MRTDKAVKEFEEALDEAMMALRGVVYRREICPRCFVEVLVDRLAFELDHNISEHVDAPPPIGDLAATPPAGSA
jgi:hypothetical protein